MSGSVYIGKILEFFRMSIFSRYSGIYVSLPVFRHFLVECAKGTLMWALPYGLKIDKYVGGNGGRIRK
jgi:hypothetical protein